MLSNTTNKEFNILKNNLNIIIEASHKLEGYCPFLREALLNTFNSFLPKDIELHFVSEVDGPYDAYLIKK